MLAPEEMVSLHATASASLPGRCDVTRKVRTRQANGSWKDDKVTVASNLPCRKVPTGQTPTEQAMMETTLSGTGVATFIIGSLIDVSRDCIVRYPTGDGREYQVAGVLDRSGSEYTRVVVYDDSTGTPAS